MHQCGLIEPCAAMAVLKAVVARHVAPQPVRCGWLPEELNFKFSLLVI